MISHEELGCRLRAAREARGLIQDRPAEHLGLSRVAISQIESGKRTVSSIELVKLARLYGRDITSFLSDESFEGEKSPLAALFRANPDLARDERLGESLRDAVELCRAYVSLKGLLGLEGGLSVPFAYCCRDPKGVWDAIQMGEKTAEEERRRLDLGVDPIKDAAGIVEAQGIPVIEVDLGEDVSGIFMAHREAGPCIFINQKHVRQAPAFTIAHEYGHVLLDRDKITTVSRASHVRDLLEVRANAFAAAFLMPEEGVRQSLRSLGKGEDSREKLVTYGGEETPSVGQRRRLASEQALTVYDVVQLHHHFGTRYEAALYRLKNLKVLSDEDFERLFQKKEEARQIAADLRLSDSEQGAQRTTKRFPRSFLGMAIEAYRREEITHARLLELAERVEVSREQVDRVLNWMGIEEEP